MSPGKSEEVFGKFRNLPGAVHRGSGLRQFLFVGGKRGDRVLLVAHADTFWDEEYNHGTVERQEIADEAGVLRNLAGGLGADDRAGCAMLWLLRDLGHSLLVTSGEERGGVGSRWLMSDNADVAREINASHRFVVQLDRRNARDFKCYSVGTDDFRSYIAAVTGFSEPDRECFTDIVTLCREIPGVNLSIGYRNEHTSSEILVAADWLNSLALCRRWLSSPGLPGFSLPSPIA